MPHKKKRLSAKDIVHVGALVAQRVSRRTIMAQNQAVPERLIRELSRVRLGQDEFRQLMINELENAAHEALESWRQDLRDGRVPPASKPIASAIFLDKAAMLNSKAAMADVNVSDTVNKFHSPDGRTKEEIIAELHDIAPVLLP
jgi:hypothetical protein